MQENVRSIRSDILLLRQKSHEYNEELEEGKRLYMEQERRERQYKYMVLVAVGLIAVSVYVWRRYNR